MIVACSTSSPMASVALIGPGGEILASACRLAPQAASGAVAELLADLLSSTRLRLEDATGFVADTGPGSFTGVRVGITMMKVLAWSLGVRTAGVPAFDLISASAPVIVPSRKNECFLRATDGSIGLVREAPEGVHGYGLGLTDYPLASRVASLIPGLSWREPEALVPEYLLEPSISTPKTPFRTGAQS